MKLLFDKLDTPEVAGIYRIIISGKSYVGSSKGVKTRLSDHRKELKGGYHGAKYMQRCFNQHGKQNTYYEILHTWDHCPKREELLQKEKDFIDLYKPEFNSKLDPTTENNAITTSKVVYQYHLNGTFIRQYCSTREAYRQTGLQVSCAANSNLKQYKSIGGYRWSYEKYDVLPDAYVNNSRLSKVKVVSAYDISGRKIQEFQSAAHCARELLRIDPEDKHLTGSITSMVSTVCRKKAVSFKGYRYAFGNEEQLDNSWIENMSRGFPIVQRDQNDTVLKIWRDWKEIKEHFNIRFNFVYLLEKQDSKWPKQRDIFNYKWHRLGVGS